MLHNIFSTGSLQNTSVVQNSVVDFATGNNMENVQFSILTPKKCSSFFLSGWILNIDCKKTDYLNLKPVIHYNNLEPKGKMVFNR